MKITKPKKNQLLLEDKELEQFDLEVKSKTGLKKGRYNNLYQGLILAYRNPGMDASKQIFSGSPISIITLLCSCLENLVRSDIIDISNLDEIISMIKESLGSIK